MQKVGVRYYTFYTFTYTRAYNDTCMSKSIHPHVSAHLLDEHVDDDGVLHVCVLPEQLLHLRARLEFVVGFCWVGGASIRVGGMLILLRNTIMGHA